ncbi:MAG: hypothetical protein ABW005_12830 [Burkholderiaceae bacterium]
MNNLDDKNRDAPTPPDRAGELKTVQSLRRRKLLRGAALGTPALLALKSTPVMACNCKLPSGFSASGNLSRTGSKNCTDPGAKPSTWKGKCGGSPLQYSGTTCRPSQTFSTYFTSTTSYPNSTLDTCLGKGDSNDQALIVAVYLESCVNGGTRYPNTTTVKNLWNQGMLQSNYKPVPSIPSIIWGPTEVRAYLKYLTSQA